MVQNHNLLIVVQFPDNEVTKKLAGKQGARCRLICSEKKEEGFEK